MSLQTERLIGYIQRQREVEYKEAYRFIHAYFPSLREFNDIVSGCVSSGQVRMEQRTGGAIWLIANHPTAIPEGLDPAEPPPK
jgi:hypothetical protein